MTKWLRVFFTLFTAVQCLEIVQAVSRANHIQHAIRKGAVASQAVNLGGWLVTEYWMSYNSKLFEHVPAKELMNGEYAIMKSLGKEDGTAAFEAHRKTWITEQDIASIASYGLNTVRVPIGYWILNDDPEQAKNQSDVSKVYARGSLKYLDTLINKWAVKYNLAVIVSLHAHQGSQNGMEHSAPVYMGHCDWFHSRENTDNSIQLAAFIAARYRKSPAFLGMALLNEPLWAQDYNWLEQYFLDAYQRIRASGDDCILITSPCLTEQGPPTMMNFMRPPQYTNVWHDWHIYYKWGYANWSLDRLFSAARGYPSSHYAPWSGNPILLGEWSLATDDTVPLTREQMQDFGRIEFEAATGAKAGWAFWSWRHDNETTMLSGWSMRQLLKEKIITIPKAKEYFPYNSSDSASGSFDDIDSSSNSGSGVPSSTVNASSNSSTRLDANPRPQTTVPAASAAVDVKTLTLLNCITAIIAAMAML